MISRPVGRRLRGLAPGLDEPHRLRARHQVDELLRDPLLEAPRGEREDRATRDLLPDALVHQLVPVPERESPERADPIRVPGPVLGLDVRPGAADQAPRVGARELRGELRDRLGAAWDQFHEPSSTPHLSRAAQMPDATHSASPTPPVSSTTWRSRTGCRSAPPIDVALLV